MSISTDANDSAIRRTSGPFVDEQNFTWCAWVYGTNWAGTANFGVMFAVNNETGGGTWTGVNLFAVSDTGVLQHVNDSFDQDTLVSSIPEDEWCWLAGRRDGTDIKGWKRSASDTSFTTGTNTTAANSFTQAAHWGFGDDDNETTDTCAFRWYKTWDAVLTDAQIENEYAYGFPRHWTDLVDFLPLKESTTTIQNLGPGGDWTELNGANLDTVTNEPPINWGISAGGIIVPASAIEIEQEGFRFYNDGTESGSTARVAQDTNDTNSKDTLFIVRVLLDASGDPTGKLFRLEHRAVGDGSWIVTPVE